MNEENLTQVAKEGYGRNAYVKAGINLIANSFSILPFITKKKIGEGKTIRVYDTPIDELLNNPNEHQGRTQLLFQFAADYKNYGMSYWHLPSADRGDTKGQPRFIYPLKPDKTKIIEGTWVRPIDKFIYEEYTKKEIDYKDMLYIRNYNPTSYWYGMSDVFTVGNIVDLNNYQVAWNVGLLKNKGVPPFWLKTDYDLTAEQAQEIADSFVSNFSGFDNAGKPFVGSNGITIEPVGLKSSDIDWLKGMQETGNVVLYGLGVPPELIINNENINTGNRKVSERAFYLQTVIPMARIFMDRFNAVISKRFYPNGDVYLDIDYDQILALREDFDLIHQRARADYLAGLIGRDEGRGLIGEEETGDNIFVQPMNVGNVGEDVKPNDPITEV